MQEKILSVLIIEDDEMDASLLELALKKHFGTVDILWVDSNATFQTALATRAWDIVLSDYSLPQFTGLEALLIARKAYPDMPFIFVSGTMGEDLAVEAIKAGASDYIVKGQLERLLPAITRELAATKLNQERRKIDAELVERKELAYKIFYGGLTAMALLDDQGMLFSINDKFKQLLALEPTHNTAIRFTNYMQPEEGQRFDSVIEAQQQSKQAVTELFQVFNSNEKMMLLQLQIIPMQDSTRHYFILQAMKMENIGNKRKTPIETHDQITGLPNQIAFLGGLEKAISLCRLQNKKIVIVVVSIDRFHFYREAFGTKASDTLLSLVSTQLKQGLSASGAFIAKGEADIFYVMRMVNQWQDNYPLTLAKRINDFFSEKMLCEGEYLDVALSVGMSVFPFHGEGAKNLLNVAEIALDDAHTKGLNQSSVFDMSMQTRLDGQKRLQLSIQKGLEAKEFFNYYQPKFNASSGEIVGVEALMRWRHGEVLISPTEFISFAEQMGLIIPLGYHAFNHALEDYNAFEKSLVDYNGIKARLEYLPQRFQIAVNVSVKQFSDPDLITKFKESLEQHGLSTAIIELEITESVLLEDTVKHMQRVHELKAAGFSIAIDDFGTGFSSLRYLKDLPVDTVKIDKSFIDDVPIDSRSCAIVSGVIVVAHSLGMKVVAEGVETEAQLAYLKRQGCDIIQGYLLSKPLSAEQLQALLKK